VLSYLPGQRLSRCTCPGESHPGPIHSDGTYVGRGAPEIDVFEAQVRLISVSAVVVVLPSDMRVKITGRPLTGQVSQSGQWAVRKFHFLHHPNVLKIAALAL
jgi:beta-glucan synthesis-associated protein KRE6